MRNWLTVSRARGLLRVRPCPCVRAHARPCGVRPCPRVACVVRARACVCARERMRIRSRVYACAWCVRARPRVCARRATKITPKTAQNPRPPTPKKRPRAFDVKYSLLHLRAVFNCACFFALVVVFFIFLFL